MPDRSCSRSARRTWGPVVTSTGPARATPRTPSAAAAAYWTGKLDSKAKTRGDVIVGFSESSEGKRRLAPQVFITVISQGMLRVSPSATYWDAAFPVFKAGEKELAWLAQTTLLSPGYAARF